MPLWQQNCQVDEFHPSRQGQQARAYHQPGFANSARPSSISFCVQSGSQPQISYTKLRISRHASGWSESPPMKMNRRKDGACDQRHRPLAWLCGGASRKRNPRAMVVDESPWLITSWSPIDHVA